MHNVVDAMITKEFAFSRGAIHYHSLNYSDQLTSEEIDADKVLVNLSIDLYRLFTKLDEFINIHFTYSALFDTNPTSLIHGKAACDDRELFFTII